MCVGTTVYDPLTGNSLAAGFLFNGKRIPLVNPQRGIFKPRQMRFLLSIKTVFPRPGGKIWYDDQREVHRQIFAGDETVEYAFMGQNPEAADNRWLREAYEHGIPVIYFLGIGHYQSMLPAFISGWDATALKARVAFGVLDQEALVSPENAPARSGALRSRTTWFTSGPCRVRVSGSTWPRAGLQLADGGRPPLM